MKIRLAVFVFLAGFISVGLYAQNINNGRRYIKNAKLAFSKDKMNPRIRSSLLRAVREDKNNPETYFLISLYFFNLDVDHQKAKNALDKFKNKMSGLRAIDGGRYSGEYKRLQIYVDRNTLTRQELGDELYKKAWVAIEQEGPKELCLQSATRIRSFLASGNLVQIKEELTALKSNCAKTDETLKQTALFLEAYYELENNSLNTSFQLNNRINSVQDEYKSLYAEFESKLKIKINEKSGQMLKSSNENINAGELANARQKLNGIIQYMPLLNAASKSEYHYQYALIYKKDGNGNQASEEIKKAENINYQPNKDKIAELMTQISTLLLSNNGNNNPNSAITFNKTVSEVQRLLAVGSTTKAMEILNNISNPETLSKKDHVRFLLFKTKINIMEKRFSHAANGILDIEKLKAKDPILQSIKNEFSTGITAALRNGRLQPAQEYITQLEFALNNNLIFPEKEGLVNFSLAKFYKGINRNKFNDYKNKAREKGYNSQELAALQWDDRPESPVRNPEPAHWDVPSVDAAPFVLTIQSDEDKGIYITEKRRYIFDGPLVANGISRAKKTNSAFSLNSATGYEIELENGIRKGREETLGDWYLALMLTSVLGSLVFIR